MFKDKLCLPLGIIWRWWLFYVLHPALNLCIVYCPEYNFGSTFLDTVPCNASSGCPDTFFLSNEVYKCKIFNFIFLQFLLPILILVSHYKMQLKKWIVSQTHKSCFCHYIRSSCNIWRLFTFFISPELKLKLAFLINFCFASI